MNDDRRRKRDTSLLGALHELAAPFVITVSVASASSIGCWYGNPGGDEGSGTSSTSSSSDTDTSTSTSTSTASTSDGMTSSTSTSTSTSATATTTSTSASSSTAATEGTTGESTSTAGTTTGGAGPGFDPDDGAIQLCVDPYASDPVEIFDAAIKGDVLFLDIGYGGGCEDHLFGLCWDGLFAESEPVQVSIALGHDAQGDACEAYIMEQKAIDLGPLRQAWIDAYGQQSGTITIHLAGFDQPIDYTF